MESQVLQTNTVNNWSRGEVFPARGSIQIFKLAIQSYLEVVWQETEAFLAGAQ